MRHYFLQAKPISICGIALGDSCHFPLEAGEYRHSRVLAKATTSPKIKWKFPAKVSLQFLGQGSCRPLDDTIYLDLHFLKINLEL